ncbi:type I restriction enzyme r protein [Mycoplasma mobile 163K]|uniref:Type I restriction enzyme endonuclease subunit n=1 Tax=Mycoplasma mobile (strain ATCC 43663 / 163K / NCTC 11711) TaxID=267748 RepID=Q6KI07_MYCM1|nr:type I restriction enzyme r protein [Mycoplasma mobile 163K]
MQVINQYSEDEGIHHARYDVTILINGLPIIHIELKRRGIKLKEAFNQIKRYQRDNFWASKGIFNYVQIFVISNGESSKYYSNTARSFVLQDKGDKNSRSSFEFTSHWADSKNKPISDLSDFTKTFFAKHTILNILAKYCVFTTENELLVMRPYQIFAVEQIISKINNTHLKLGNTESGGYIWHTTGSGKTLTSFKTAQIASKLVDIDKVLFIVDRKDLDYQTMREYDKFKKNSADSNTNTKILKEQLESSDSKIIITTIQKLSRFVAMNKNHEIFKKRIVFIFDECHRSQFGNMHNQITNSFKNYNLFGFTGTPIFSINAKSGHTAISKTTEESFGDKLHTYTIVDAISDNNVLKFKIDYFNTFKMSEKIEDKNILSIDIEKVVNAPERITSITKYILEHFDQKTKRFDNYYFENKNLKEKKLQGFNSIFAVQSIKSAKLFYAEFKKQMTKIDHPKKLNIATIFSFNPNEEILDEEDFETNNLDKSSRDFLDEVIKDYNQTFKQNFDTSSEKFQNYYKDISLKMKNREIDLLIVVNMFLTGFDSQTLNTLWVDKNLKHHGLIQAFSRTNRILNSIKTFGNIVCFRDLSKETDEALSLYGNSEIKNIVLLKDYDSYYDGYFENEIYYKGYKELIEELKSNFPVNEKILGEENQKKFIKLYNSIAIVKNILDSYDQFDETQKILSERDFQNYQGKYHDVHENLVKNKNQDKEFINEDIVFEMELVKQSEINVDYILKEVVKQLIFSSQNKKALLPQIETQIQSSTQLRSKKDLIINFINEYNMNISIKDENKMQNDIEDNWKEYFEKEKQKELDKLIEEENLIREKVTKFFNNSFRDGELNTEGTEINSFMPHVSRFENRAVRKQGLISKLKEFFEKFFSAF